MRAAPLRVLPRGRLRPGPAGGRDELCAAWPALELWEHRAESVLGPEFAELVVVLWVVHRFAVCTSGMVVVDALLDESMQLREPQPVLEDVASLAFALGAAWASRGHAPRPHRCG